MHLDTGKLYELSNNNDNNIEDFVSERDKLLESLIDISLNDATEKQKKNMKVSLYDNRSKLGKLRISEKTKRNREKRLRKKKRK